MMNEVDEGRSPVAPLSGAGHDVLFSWKQH